jgi:hypothetical protein
VSRVQHVGLGGAWIAAGLGVALAKPWLLDGGRNFAAGVAVVLLLVAAHRLFGSALLSPVQIVGGGLLTLAVLGRLLYADVADAKGGGAIRIHLDEVTAERTQFLILMSAASLLLGAILVVLLTGRAGDIRQVSLRALHLESRSRKLIVLAAPLPLLLLVVGFGPDRLVRRNLYIETHVGSSPLTSLGTSLSVAMIVGLGYLWGTRTSRIWVTILTFGYTLAFLGLGSRRLALIPILFALGVFAALPNRRSRWLLAGTAVLSVYLVGLPLAFRGLPAHGIAPYLDALPDIMRSEHPWAATGRNLLIGFALIGQTAFGLAAFPKADIAVALNPLPGGPAGWYDIADSHRLNIYTPTAGLGELGNAGWEMAILVCLMLGAVLAYVDVRSKRLMARDKQLFGLALVLLGALFLLLITQYNLRSATRMLYYAVALDVLATTLIMRTRSKVTQRPGEAGLLAGAGGAHYRKGSP